MSAAWTVAYAVLAGVVVLVALALVGTMRRIAAVLEGAEAVLRESASNPSPGPGGLRAGAAMPAFQAMRLHDGFSLTSEQLVGSPAVVLFLSSTCPACAGLARELRRKAPRVAVPLYLVFATESEVRAVGLERLDNVLVQNRSEVSIAFETSTTPHAFAIDASGVVVGTTTPNTFSQLQDFIRATLGKGGDVQPQSETELVHA